MGESGPFYLTSVSNGHVLARSPNGQPSGVVVQNRGDQDQPQQWMIEQGDEPDVIALRCLSNDQYLHANGGTNWSTVGTGEKQWWRCSGQDVTAPQACRLSPVDYPNVYLNHFQGIRVAKGQSMKVHMWQWDVSIAGVESIQAASDCPTEKLGVLSDLVYLQCGFGASGNLPEGAFRSP